MARKQVIVGIKGVPSTAYMICDLTGVHGMKKYRPDFSALRGT
jgi:hypothetical protein